MAAKDYMDSHVGIAVAATAIVCSPRMREILRRGAVYGVAGALVAGDAVASFARGVGRGAQEAQAAASAPSVMETTAENTDAPMAETQMEDGDSADAPAQADAKVGRKARSPRTKASAKGGNQSAEVNGDE